MSESFEEKVERIAKAWHEKPCPPEDGPFCNPELHVWETAHVDDMQWGLDHVRFVLEHLDG